MSIKKLFGKKSIRITRPVTEQSIKTEIESPEFAEAVTEQKERFVPQIVFEYLANFAR